MRHYCGPIFLLQVANAIGDDEPRSGVQMAQAQRLSSAVGWRLPWLVQGPSQPTTHYPWPFPSIERCPAARNSSCFKVSAPALAR